MSMQPALFVTPLDGGRVTCQLCAHFCELAPGQTGPCRVRHNVEGTLYTSAYGRPVLLGVEPIEKKYLFHAFPGSRTLSLGTPGCNMGCRYCINWRVSQRGTEDEAIVSPAAVVERALAESVDCIAFTYTEPTIFIEYALDIAQAARRVGLRVVAKSNGLMSAEALRAFAPHLDAINIDVKGWHAGSHYQMTGSHLEPVLASLRLARDLGLWLEVSTLVVPGLNDTAGALRGIATFISRALGPETPWHVQRFFPNYRLTDRPATAQTTLQQAVDLGRAAGLHHIYNKELAQGQQFQTRCPHCQTVVIERAGFALTANRLQAGRCPGCHTQIAGVGLTPLEV